MAIKPANSPVFDVNDCNTDVYTGMEDNPDELSPFELQYLSEYSARDIEESLFYEQGEPV